MKFTDALICDGALQKVDDGWAIKARVARGGNIQEYLGEELGVTDKRVVRVYRPADEVFSRDAMATYARKPIAIGHPPEGVTPENWKDLAVGEIDRDVMRDGEFVSVPLLFRDQAAVENMQNGGPRELSMGYDAKINFEPGFTDSGEEYDAVMSDFRMNHVAVVRVARGGPELRVGDGADKWGAAPITMSDQKGDQMSNALKTVVLGDKAVHVAADDLQAIDAYKAAQGAKLADMQAQHDAALAAKDAEIDRITAAKDAAEAKVLSDADIDARVAARASLIDQAKTIAPDLKTDGLSDADIRKAVVVSKVGDHMKEKSAEYIASRFDALVEDAGKHGDAVADAIKTSDRKVVGLDEFYDKRDRELSNAWKNTKEAK